MKITDEHRLMLMESIDATSIKRVAATMGVDTTTVYAWRAGKSGISKMNARNLKALYETIMATNPPLPVVEAAEPKIEAPARIMLDADTTHAVDLKCPAKADPVLAVIEAALAHPTKMRLSIVGREITGIVFL